MFSKIYFQLIFLFFIGIEIETIMVGTSNNHSLKRKLNESETFNEQMFNSKVHPLPKKIKIEAEKKEKYERIILASNAPPFGLQKEELKHPLNSNNPHDPKLRKIANERYLKNKENGGFKKSKLNEEEKWKAIPASGGLVSAVKSMMEKNNKNIWVFHVTPSDPKLAKENDPKLQELKKHKEAFELDSVLIDLTTYEFYYKEISNSILWPALHNIPKYIVYEEKKLDVYLNGYKQVNEMFATTIYNINRTINDFIWVQDYQLLLVGKYLRNKEKKENKTMNLGFFLHTPFELKDEFINNFKKFTREILEGILSFNKVGFQTNKDRNNFIEVIEKNFPDCVTSKYNNLIYIYVENITPKRGSFLGVYPATINIDKFINYDKEEALKKKDEIKKKIMKNASGKLFFSVERFDYTKGILEKIKAFREYLLLNNSERAGKDVFYQLAPLNRESIASYKEYQNECLKLIEEINEEFGYVAIYINTNSMKSEDVLLHYFAMDIGVITPVMDGMNLVAKEMMVSNPKAAIILSKGAGTHHQLYENGLSNNYFLVKDINNIQNFAQVMKDSIGLSEDEQLERGTNLRNYLIKYDNGKWSEEFLYGN